MQTTINVDYTKVHVSFKLNGYSLNKDDLCRVAYSFIKEGEEYEKPVGDFLLDWFNDSEFIHLQTSGSTGSPKNLVVSKQAMVNSAIATGDYFDLNPGDKILNCLPVKYIAGKLMFIRAFILGLEMDFVAPSSRPLDRIENCYDFCAMVPLQAQNSIKKLHIIKKVIIGGARISKKLAAELKQVDSEIYETYGMTETVTHIAVRKLSESNFEVLPHISISQDERSCLVIDAPSILANQVVTNDLVTLVSPKHFKFLGRIDNIINSGGIKFLPEAIEEKLAKKIDRRFFISGETDEVLGEKIILIVEGESFEINDKIFKKLDKFEKPKQIYFVQKFIETENGKTIRNATKELALNEMK